MIRKIENITNQVIVINDNMFPLYIIKGDKNYLIDCGISARSELFYEKIKNTINSEKIDVVLLTHSHYDHTGACSYLQDIYNFEIFGSNRTIELLKKPTVISFINKLNQEFNRIEKSDNIKCTKLNNLISLENNQTIQIDKDNSLTAIETKGHTQCSMSYLLLPTRILFPGDSTGVMEKNGSIKPLFLSSFNEYIKSIKTLIDLNAEILAFPHNRFIKGKNRVKKHLEMAIFASEKLKTDIVEELQKGKSTTTIAEDLLTNLFPDPTISGPEEAFMINLQAMVNTVKRENK